MANTNTTPSKVYNRLKSATVIGAGLADEYGISSDWYATATSQVQRAADIVGMPADYVAGITAITSASCTVLENCNRSWLYLTTGKVYFMGDNCNRYRDQYAQTGDATIYSPTGKPTPKTDAFRRNICPLNFDPTAITVDRHVADCATDRMGTEITPTLQYRCEVAIRRISAELGISPCHTQACLWFATKWAKGHREVGSVARCPFSELLIGDYFEARAIAAA